MIPPLAELAGSAAPAPEPPALEMLPAVESYISHLGLKLTPIRHGTKRPYRDRWTETHIGTVDAAREHWANSPTDGVGVVLGASEIVSLDVDDLEASRVALAAVGIDLGRLLATSPAPRVRGGDGRAKLLFRASWAAVRKLVWVGIGTVFELRAGPGQDLLPPSWHPGAQRPYVWVDRNGLPCAPPASRDDFPEVPPDLSMLYGSWDALHPQLVAADPKYTPPEPVRARKPRPRDASSSDTSDDDRAWAELRATALQKTDLQELFAELGIKARGRKRWQCPYHMSLTGGFSMWEDEQGRQRWNCHHGSAPVGTATSAGGSVGDALDLVQAVKRMTIQEATLYLARRLNLQLPPLRRGREPAESEGPGSGGQARTEAPAGNWTPEAIAQLDLDPRDLLHDEHVESLAALPVDDWRRVFHALKARWPRAGIWRDLRAAVKRERGRLAADRRKAAAAEDPRPEINAEDEMHVKVDACERALADAGADIFAAPGGLLVRVFSEPPRRVKVTREEAAPLIGRVSQAFLRCELSRVARFYIVRDGVRVYQSAPDAATVDALADKGTWPHLRTLAAVAEGPLLRPDGSIASEPGYDDATGYLLMFEPELWPAIPAEPTQADAARALEALLVPFADFPFVGDADRAALVSKVLILVGRAAVDGGVPLYGVNAPTAGTGKSLLAALAAIIGTGRRPAVITWPRRGEEQAKLLLSIALAGDPCILLDNIEGDLSGGELAAALTSASIRNRLLGENKTITASWLAVVIATGNNLTPRGDLVRRTVPIRLDAECEAPDERDGWRHPDITSHVREHRRELAAAALTILRAHAVAGRPRPENLGPPLGSFESWDSVVRAAVVWAGGADPLERRAELRDVDPEREDLGALLNAWNAALGSKTVTASQVVSHATADHFGEEAREAAAELHEALQAHCKRGDVTTRNLGYALRRLVDRPCGKLVLKRDGQQPGSKSALWTVVGWGDGVMWGDARGQSGSEDSQFAHGDARNTSRTNGGSGDDHPRSPHHPTGDPERAALQDYDLYGPLPEHVQ